MRPFNLEEYLKNPSRKIVTREGRNARIVCTNFKTKHHSVLALVDYGKYECTISCSKEGKHYTGERESPNDLFFATKKHEGWINICSNLTEKDAYCGKMIHPTKADAKCFANNAIATIKIEWEE